MMEMISTASELSSGKRPVCMEERGTMEPVPINRRRQELSSTSLICNINQQGEQQQQRLPAGQTTSTTVKRSSKFRGVSRHRWTGRYEAHLWDKGSWNPTQRKKGKQVYLGAYDQEESAARAYDLAALKFWGASTFTNFPVSEYEKEIEIMKTVTKEEYLASLRRRSSGFSRGVSKYRGVARHHHNGRWEARIGRVFGNKYLYLGTYSTQEEAAHAYDIAAIECRGINAVTNFDLSTYIRWLKPGANPHPQTFQETETILDSQPLTNFLSNNITSRNQTTDLSIFNSNPFAVEALEIPKKQDYQINNTTIISPTCTKSSSSSPTALSLLLRSSVFKELVEKNLNNTGDKETEENDTKNIQKISTKDEIGEAFYDEFGISTPVQYICPSKMYCMI